MRTGTVVNQAPVEPESCALTETAVESESPMLHQDHPLDGLFLQAEGMRTGSGVNEAPVGLQSRTLTETAVESESPMLHQDHPLGGLFLSRGDENGFGSE